MKTQIFIVSHRKDFDWLRYCIKSIDKFATGFDGVTVIVPQRDFDIATIIARDFPNANLSVRSGDEPPAPLGHLWHNIQKCRADQLCPSADYILHIDSDCIFREPVTPEDYFVDGKPVLLIQEYAQLEKDFPGFPWRPVVERTLKHPVKYETMRRQPMVNPVGIYDDVRNAVESAQQRSFDAYVLSQKSDYPCGFAEFNTIGAIAVMYAVWRDKYHFIDVGKNPYPHSKVIQFWSHGGLNDPTQHIWIDGVLTKVVPIDLITSILQ